MAKPTTRDTFKDHCLRRLGWPVIEINVDDDQIDDRVDEALEYYQKQHVDGTVRSYFSHQITEQDKTNRYITISDDIKGVIRVFSPSSSSSRSINMFDMQYQMRLNDLQTYQAGDASNYVIQQQYLRTLDMLFAGEIPIRFNKHTDRIYIDMDWANDIATGEYLVFEVFEMVNPETYPDIWTDSWLQKYATALIKMQWGNNMKKFSGVQLPGGITMNGQQIFDEAVAELKELREEVEAEPPMFIMG